jgi:hypothetical protein
VSAIRFWVLGIRKLQDLKITVDEILNFKFSCPAAHAGMEFLIKRF